MRSTSSSNASRKAFTSSQRLKIIRSTSVYRLAISVSPVVSGATKRREVV
jgi:hypothetical protein